MRYLILYGMLLSSCNSQHLTQQNKTYDQGVVNEMNQVEQDIKLPEILEKPKIDYPLEAISYGKSVKVIIKANVDSQGNVNRAKVAWSQNSLFDKYAVELAYKYKFKPGKINGTVSDIWISWPIIFDIDKK